jgi:hypothetical protein
MDQVQRSRNAFHCAACKIKEYYHFLEENMEHHCTKEAFKLYLKIHISFCVILRFCCSGEMSHHATEWIGNNQAVAQRHPHRHRNHTAYIATAAVLLKLWIIYITVQIGGYYKPQQTDKFYFGNIITWPNFSSNLPPLQTTIILNSCRMLGNHANKNPPIIHFCNMINRTTNCRGELQSALLHTSGNKTRYKPI